MSSLFPLLQRIRKPPRFPLVEPPTNDFFFFSPAESPPAMQRQPFPCCAGGAAAAGRGRGAAGFILPSWAVHASSVRRHRVCAECAGRGRLPAPRGPGSLPLSSRSLFAAPRLSRDLGLPCQDRAEPGRAGPPPAPPQSLRPPRKPRLAEGQSGCRGWGREGRQGPGKGRGSGQKGGIAGGTSGEIRAEG